MCCQDLTEADTSKSLYTQLKFQTLYDAKHPLLLVWVMYEEHVVWRSGSEVEQW